MNALRLFLVVALAVTAFAGEDLKKAKELSECLRDAVTQGIPSIHIPSHNPLRVDRNYSWHGDIGVASATLNISSLVWHGIPAWNATIKQLSEDSDAVASFDYRLWWKKFVLTTHYTLETNIALIPGKISGDLNITFDGTAWQGGVNLTKPGFNLTERIEDLDLVWTAKEIDLNFTGLGIINEPVSRSLTNLVQTFFDAGSMRLGLALKERLNANWFAHTERIDVILEFCKNETTTTSY